VRRLEPGVTAATGPDDVVGRVLGTEDATPLDFWVAVAPGAFLQLDDVVALERRLPDGATVRVYGVVSQVRARHEGARFDSDVFLIEDGVLPAEVTESAQVTATRFEPEVFVPPLPGQQVRKATGDLRGEALFFDQMLRRLPAGLSRDGEPFYLNLEFVDGTRGAHVNISGISGVATKTSYATFLLHSLFHSGVLGSEAVNTKALVFNVKGEDLLFLDHANTSLSAADAARYGSLGLHARPFTSVAVFAPPVRGDVNARADVASRQQGVTSFFWTIADFCRERLLAFLFADVEDDRQQYPMVVHNVAARLEEAVPVGDGAVQIDGALVRTFRHLVEVIEEKVDPEGPDQWGGRAMGAGTVNAFMRRLHGAVDHVQHLVRADVPKPEEHGVDFDRGQVTVVDLHNLNDRAKRFVVGVVLRKAFERKERSGQARPLQFVVLDELNKYAPREGSSPIKEILLDVAERGRSLGIILIGAQQTASEVERRVVANAAVRVVGRLDAAEAGRGEYGFDEGERGRTEPGQHAARRSLRGVLTPVKLLHTSDWHVGKAIRGRSRATEHRAVLAEIAGIADGEAVDVVVVVGDLFDSASPTPESEQVVYDALLGLAGRGSRPVVAVAGNHESPTRFEAVRPVFAAHGVHLLARPTRPDDGGVLTLDTGAGPVRLGLLPFPSHRVAATVDDLMAHRADEHAASYADRVRRLLDLLTAEFADDAVNVVAAHLMVMGGLMGGGERGAHTVFDYWVPAPAFPGTAHYVALGHLHRAQQIDGPSPLRYCGSPLQLDFGESANQPSVTVVAAEPGRPGIDVRAAPLTAGRRLRTVTGPRDELLAIPPDDLGDDHLRLVVVDGPRPGLADELRGRFPNAVEVAVPRPHGSAAAAPASRAGRSAHELFSDYLVGEQESDPRVLALFDQLADEVGGEVAAR
jgi:uncharacterized protein